MAKRKSTGRTAEYWIKHLRLKPHPEGGWFRQAYRSAETIARKHLPARYKGNRAFSTAIYFLLRGNEFSAFHRLKSDETWHFYDGMPVAIFIIGKSGKLTTAKLGLNPEAGEKPQVVIKANSWFAATLLTRHRKFPISNFKPYALVGCTVSPGFDFADFELGKREQLTRCFPRHRALIARLAN